MTEIRTENGLECPACSGKRHTLAKVACLYECRRCGALHGRCYRGDVYQLVHLHMPMQADAPPEELRYFDLVLLGSTVERTHGWYDRRTKRVVQYG